MLRWLVGLLIASFLTPVFAEAPKYLFCPVSDAQLPGPNIKVTKNFWGTRKLYVLKRGVWEEQKLQSDSETELIYEDGWGPSSDTCKDKSVSEHCPTIKKISLLVLARQDGNEFTVVDAWATKRCCSEGKILNPGDAVSRNPCLVLRLAE
jgi:hypothetical protein